MLLKTSPSFWATMNKFMMFASWSQSSLPYINMSLWIASTPEHCATMSSMCIWKMSRLILSPNGTHKNLYLPRCVLNVVNNDAFSVRCIPKKALLLSTLENLVAPVRMCAISSRVGAL